MFEWTALILSAFVVGLSKAGFGSGVGMVAVPLMVMAIGPVKMLGVLLPVLILGDVLSLPHYRGDWDRRNVAMILGGFTFGVAAGTAALSLFEEIENGAAALGGLIGGICIVFVAIQTVLLVRRRGEVPEEAAPPYRPAVWHGLLVGAAAGLTSTVAHAAGPIVAMFLLPQRLGKRVYVGTSLVYFVFGNLIKVGPYVWRGYLTMDELSFLPYLAPAILVGTLLGAWMNRRIPARAFSAVIYVVVLATGIRLILKVFGV